MDTMSLVTKQNVEKELVELRTLKVPGAARALTQLRACKHDDTIENDGKFMRTSDLADMLISLS